MGMQNFFNRIPHVCLILTESGEAYQVERQGEVGGVDGQAGHAVVRGGRVKAAVVVGVRAQRGREGGGLVSPAIGGPLDRLHGDEGLTTSCGQHVRLRVRMLVCVSLRTVIAVARAVHSISSA